MSFHEKVGNLKKPNKMRKIIRQENVESFMMITDDQFKFQFNMEYLLMYNKHNIYFYPLKYVPSEDTKEKVDLDIQVGDQTFKDEYGTQQIDNIYFGNDQDEITIIIDSDGKNDILFTWDLDTNTENEGYDLGKNYELIYGGHGSLYIVDDGLVYFTNQGSANKAFGVERNDITDSFSRKIRFKGVRFDGKNHNWLIIREYMILPFSYMTFVIKDNIEKNDPMQEGNIFDPEPYNYLFNKSSCFIHSPDISNNPNTLAMILENFERTDPELLELLLYIQPLVKKEIE